MDFLQLVRLTSFCFIRVRTTQKPSSSLVFSACGYFARLTYAFAVVRLLNYPTAAINSYEQNSSFCSPLWLTLSSHTCALARFCGRVASHINLARVAPVEFSTKILTSLINSCSKAKLIVCLLLHSGFAQK